MLKVYYSLVNIDPKYISKLTAIRLLAIAKLSELAKLSDLSHHGVDVVLERIQNDLDVLYYVEKIQTSNGKIDFFGSFIYVCGDNLAQHELGRSRRDSGLCAANAGTECTFEDMQRNFDEKDFV